MGWGEIDEVDWGSVVENWEGIKKLGDRVDE
jgi:hypothetical protein